VTEVPFLRHTLLRLWSSSRSPTVTQLTYGLRRVEALAVQPVSSGDDCLLPEQDLGFDTAAIRAVELVDSKIAASWVWFYNRRP
jgi:hypothetical protein